MFLLEFIRFTINILLIVLILIRNPNEQSFQENLTFFNFFDSFSSAQKTIDKYIKILISAYFVLGLISITHFY